MTNTMHTYTNVRKTELTRFLARLRKHHLTASSAPPNRTAQAYRAQISSGTSQRPAQVPCHHTSRTTPSCRPLGTCGRRGPPRGCICNAAPRPHHEANCRSNMLSRLPVDPGPHPGQSHATVEAQTRRSNLRCHAPVRLRRTAHREDLANLRMQWPSGSGDGHLLSAPTSYQLLRITCAEPVPASCSRLACIGTFLGIAAKTFDHP